MLYDKIFVNMSEVQHYLDLYPLLYLEINLVAVFVVLIVRIKTMGISQMFAQQNFAKAVYAEIVFFMTDTMHVLMEYGIIPFNTFFLLLFKSGYFISTTLMCYYWFIYFEHIQESSLVKDIRKVMLSSFLVCIMAILLIVNISTGILFYVEDGIYCRGPYFILLYALSYPYVMLASVKALITLIKDKKDFKKLFPLVVFPVPPAIAGLIQLYHPDMPIACVTLAIETLIMYLNWMDEMVSIDPLTRLNNRKQLEYHYNHWQKNLDEDDLYLFIIDADKFKSINDNFGHIEGDQALLRISLALRESCKIFPKRANIARFGGDEFVVLATTDDETLIEKMKEEVATKLAKINKEEKAPYNVTVSIGVAKGDRNRPISELIKEADKQLYEHKRR